MTMHDAPTHRHDASHSPCARFRAVLSGYLDGMLTREEHRAADEHLEACLECRSIVDESERLDRSLAAMIDDAAADPLPEGFAGAVLARTAHAEQREEPSSLPFVAWLGWVAAAAAITFAIAVWNIDASRETTLNASVASPPEAYQASRPWQRSETLAPQDGPTLVPPRIDETARFGNASFAAPPVAPGELDVAAAYSAATALEHIVRPDRVVDRDSVDFVIAVSRYDDLVRRLTVLADDLPAGPAASALRAADLLRSLEVAADRDGLAPETVDVAIDRLQVDELVERLLSIDESYGPGAA